MESPKESEMETTASPFVGIHLFRDFCLRLHDNPAFTKTLQSGYQPKLVYIFDEFDQKRVSEVVWKFKTECIQDLDTKLRRHGMRLHIFKGQLFEILPKLFMSWGNIAELTYMQSYLSFEARDFEKCLDNLCRSHEVQPWGTLSHTLYSHQAILEASKGVFPTNYREFEALVPSLGHPEEPIANPLMFISPFQTADEAHPDEVSMTDLVNACNPTALAHWEGGESAALGHLSIFCQQRLTIQQDPLISLMSKTTLSPYFRFGCLSMRLFYMRVYEFGLRSTNGQALCIQLFKKLLMREFSYHISSIVPKFGHIQGNPYCINIPWENKMNFVEAFRDGCTGFPMIDAIIRQIRKEGWCHHFARQCLSVFITRGCLWISWVLGRDFFQQNMLDFEYPVSTVCWMQDSCSGFFKENVFAFNPYKISKQIDPSGLYIKTYCPELSKFPSDYIHTPWKAPRHIQEDAECIIGQHYPAPVCDYCEQDQLCCKRLTFIADKLRELYGTVSA